MSDLEKAQQLKEELDRMRREADEARGALRPLLKQIKKEFRCSTLAELKDWIEAAEKEEAVLRAEADKYEREFLSSKIPQED